MPQPTARAARARRARRRAPGRVVDAAGGVAVHTGADCIPCAGDATGEHSPRQANMMARDTVPAAMAAGFEAAEGDLADRLLAALDAAEGEGGDVRGRQSAALVVVPAAGRGVAGALRPAGRGPPRAGHELRRLLALARAYELAGAGRRAAGLRPAGRGRRAVRARRRARARTPTSCCSGPGWRRPTPGDAERGRGRGPPRDRDPPGLAATCSTGSRRTSPPRASASGESSIELAQQITCSWNGRPALPAASRWSTRPGSRPGRPRRRARIGRVAR